MNNNTISVVVKNRVEIERYYVLRGINVDKNGVKTVIEEKEVEVCPFTKDAPEEIAQMLVDNPDVTFCTIAENYRLSQAESMAELPFT